MNPPKCDELNYIHSLVAIQKVFTCTQAARCQPEGKASAHDAFTRLLQRQSPDKVKGHRLTLFPEAKLGRNWLNL
jgi:hypothetical protein